jgi:undecaprenyl-diphosphatase
MQQFSLWQVLVLAIVQGITEFLPVSSDGHLALAKPLLWGSGSPPNSLDLTIVLHLGTLVSILVYYRRRIVLLMGQDRRVIWSLVLGTVPLVIVVLICKLAFDTWFEPVLESTPLAGMMLPVTGIALIWAQRNAGGNRDYRDLRWSDSLLIGTAQAAAILPGLSRSGSTIATELLLGLSRSAAVTYSFLLAIPALAGAGVYGSFKMWRHPENLSTSAANLAIGAAVSFIVGLGALGLLERVVERGRLHYFGWYCIALGIAVIGLTWPKWVG